MEIPITRRSQQGQQLGKEREQGLYGREQFAQPESRQLGKEQFGKDQGREQFAQPESRQFGKEQFGKEQGREQFAQPESRQLGKEQFGRDKEGYGREQFWGPYGQPESRQFGKEQFGKEQGREQFAQPESRQLGKEQFGRDKEGYGREQFGGPYGQPESRQFGKDWEERSKPYGERKYETSEIGKMKETQLKIEIGAADLDHLFAALKAEGLCYVKDHLFTAVTGDPGGHLKMWQRNVTRKNLDMMIEFAHECGLTLPFCCKLEEREQEIKQKTQQAGLRDLALLNEAEVLQILHNGALHLLSLYTCGFACAQNDKWRNICREACGSVSSQYLEIVNAAKRCPEYYPAPVVKSIVEKCGVSERR